MTERVRLALKSVADKTDEDEPVISYTTRFLKDCGIPETERCHELAELALKVRICQKNPGHTAFCAVSSFGPLNLPPDCRDQRVVHYLRLFSRLAVRLTTIHTSEERQGAYKLLAHGDDGGLGSRRLASGFAWLPGETSEMKCPIQDCPFDKRPHNVYGYIRVLTNKHVVYNEDEALATQGEFWDEEVRGSAYSASSRRILVKCVGLDFCQEDNDTAHLKCVTHDPWLCHDLKQEMSQLRQRYNKIPMDTWERAKNLCVTVSHPHGMRKMITIGRHIRLAETSSRSHAHYHTCATCPGSSGAPVLYTSPEIKGAVPMWLPAIHSYYCPGDDINCAFK